MAGGAWHQFISMRDHPNQSFYLEGHSSSAETVMDVGDDDNNDNDDKNNDDNDTDEDDNYEDDYGKNVTLGDARRVLRVR